MKVCKVEEVRRSSVCNTFVAESVYLVLNSLWDWEPVERFKEKSDVVSFTFCQYEMSINQNNCVLFLFYGPRFMCLKGRDFKRNEGYVHERDRKRKGHDAICYGERD